MEGGAIASVRQIFRESILALERNIDFGLKLLASILDVRANKDFGLKLQALIFALEERIYFMVRQLAVLLAFLFC